MGNVCTCAIVLLLAASASANGATKSPVLSRNARGTTVIEIVQDAHKLHIAFELTGMDAVGFEHAARSDADVDAINATMDTLQTPDAWLVANADARCHLSFSSVTPHVFRIGEGHEGKGAADKRADIDVEYIYECDVPQQLRAIEFNLIEQFPRLRGVIVNASLSSGPVQRLLSTPRATIQLAGSVAPP